MKQGKTHSFRSATKGNCLLFLSKIQGNSGKPFLKNVRPNPVQKINSHSQNLLLNLKAQLVPFLSFFGEVVNYGY